MEFSQRVLCNTMVAKVSPSCTNVEAKRLISSILNLHASAFASAVIDAVNSHEFIISPLILYVVHFEMFKRDKKKICRHTNIE